MGGLVQYTVDFGDTPKSEVQRICELLETISWNGVFLILKRPIVRFYLEQGQELDDLITLPPGCRVQVVGKG